MTSFIPLFKIMRCHEHIYLYSTHPLKVTAGELTHVCHKVKNNPSFYGANYGNKLNKKILSGFKTTEKMNVWGEQKAAVAKDVLAPQEVAHIVDSLKGRSSKSIPFATQMHINLGNQCMFQVAVPY